jgi:hypothetical protein
MNGAGTKRTFLGGQSSWERETLIATVTSKQ